MRPIGNWLWWSLLWVSLAQAQPEPMIPVVGRPKPFYGAAGNAIKLECHAESAQVRLDETVRYTLTVHGLIHPASMARPDLREDEAFRNDFNIEDEPTTLPEPAGTRIFHYRLRPHRQSITFIPGYVLHYFAPNSPRPFRTTRVDSLPLMVLASKVPPPPPVVPLDVPDFAERLALDRVAEVPDHMWWCVLIGVPLVLLFSGIIWQFASPTSFRAARRRRHQAARQALKRLRHLSPHDVDTLATLMVQYLVLRFHCPGPSRTPTEIADQLRVVGVPAETSATVVRFFHDLDESRFAPRLDERGPRLLQQAISLIEAQEANL